MDVEEREKKNFFLLDVEEEKNCWLTLKKRREKVDGVAWVEEREKKILVGWAFGILYREERLG